MIDAWTITVALLAAGAVAAYYYLKSVHSFFKDTGIPVAQTLPILGNSWKVFMQKSSFAETIQELYNTYPEAKYMGYFDFLTPTIMIRDLDLIKSITVKNFDHFQDHRSPPDVSEPLFTKNLFSLRGDQWKEMRNMLSPAFTSSKMKAMYHLMHDCAVRYGEILVTLPAEKRSVELKDAFARYTNDVIATCAFGLTVDSMTHRTNKFYVYGRKAMTFGIWRTLKFFMIRGLPFLTNALGIRLTSRKISDFFYDLVSSTIKTRDEQGIVRPDMLQLMMETRGKLGPGKELTIEDMTAQAFIFFAGGFESSSTLMCFAAYEIGVNPDIQRRLQEEIDEVLQSNNGKVSYEAINDMKYLDAIISEALRKYPVAAFVDRVCTKPFELPPALPGGKPHLVKKGEYLAIPIYGVQLDPQYYEEPTKFNPDRFLDDSKKILNSPIFLSFGMGPRMCIGNRFALLETKALLFNVFARCDFKPNERTPIPMKLSKKGFQMSAEGGFWFDVVPRKTVNHVLVSSTSNGSVRC
nr:cytochrome P450 9e2-like [Nomia melanderi]